MSGSISGQNEKFIRFSAAKTHFFNPSKIRGKLKIYIPNHECCDVDNLVVTVELSDGITPMLFANDIGTIWV